MDYQPTPKIPHPETVPNFDPAVAFGTSNHELQWVLYTQLLQAFRPTPREPINPYKAAALATLMELKPQNVLEAQHIILMILSFNAAMECATEARAFKGSPDGVDTYLRICAKMMAVYQQQMDGFNRSRGKGTPNVNVENVNIQSGGQAIVGHVEAKPRKRPKQANRTSPAAAITASPVEPLNLGPPVAPVYRDQRMKRAPGE